LWRILEKFTHKMDALGDPKTEIGMIYMYGYICINQRNIRNA
jgi:hypothetical protein